MNFHKVCALLLLVGSAACGSSDREYTLQGQILSIEPNRLQADVEHEEIKGFMAAMTMPYKVRDAKELADLKPGDLITSTLVVVSNDAYLKDVKKVGEAPLEKAPEASAAPAASAGFELLKPGEPIPDVPMLDQEGRKTSISALKGSTVVLTFIYTQCPLPNFCPAMNRNFASIQRSLAADASLKGRLKLVSVSFDPEHDTPAVLAAFAAKHDSDPAVWTWLTGDRVTTDRLAAKFGVSVIREGKTAADVMHNLRTTLVDADGRIVKIYSGADWTSSTVLSDLRDVLK